MEKSAQNIQDSFLNNARKDKIVLTIYLMSGVKLSGRIKSFDKYSLVLETNNQEQLIFKHAISTVVTQKLAHSSHSSQAAVQGNSLAAVTSRIPRRVKRRSEVRFRNGQFWSGCSGGAGVRPLPRQPARLKSRWRN